MADRHDALIPLTHDHHHALAQARRLLDASTKMDLDERRSVANDFLNFYFGQAVRHFHEEEELFFAPLIDELEARDLVLRAIADHLRLHALVRAIKRQLTKGEAAGKTLADVSRILTEHVRFEEKELFPLIERLVSEDQLQDLATVGRRDV